MGRENFVPIYAQGRYKYLLYVEGHCAACRYSFLMRLGSVILKVPTCLPACLTGHLLFDVRGWTEPFPPLK